MHDNVSPIKWQASVDANQFFADVVEAAKIGQDEVNAVVWPAMKKYAFFADLNEGRFMTRGSMTYELVAIPRFRVSVFSNPSFHENWVLEFLNRAFRYSEFHLEEVIPLLSVDGCNSWLYGKILEWLMFDNSGIACEFVSSTCENVPLEWLMDAYCQLLEVSVVEEVKFYNGENVLVEDAVVKLLLKAIAAHYPDMPETWVRQMLHSLSQTG